MSILYAIILGGVAGWLAGLIRRGEGFGILGNIIVGIIGGFIGNLVLGVIGIQSSNLIGSLAISTFGAIVLLVILNLFSGRKS